MDIETNMAKRVLLRPLLAFILCLAMAAPVAALPRTTAHPKPAAQEVTAVIQKYRQLIPRLMAEQDIPGLAVAVVDEGHVLWAEGFGYTDHDRKTPVTTDTIFGGVACQIAHVGGDHAQRSACKPQAGIVSRAIPPCTARGS